MADRDAWEQPLYRYAYLLLRDCEAARQLVAETLEAGILKRPSHIDPEHLIMLQFRDVRRKILKNQTAASLPRPEKSELAPEAAHLASEAGAKRVESLVHELAEPGRSAYALLLLDGLESEWIAKMLGLSEAELGEVVHSARVALQRALIPKPEVTP